MKKEVLIFSVLFLFGITSVYADELGCCSNPGAGPLICSTDRLALRDKECCPKPEPSFPSYYKSTQNPNGPTNYNDCTTNFFFLNKACTAVDACALGCCCSEFGGTIASEAQCKGTGQTFHKGQTDCNVVCAVPQCSDGIDNDNNTCADFVGGDAGCISPADNNESGGSCASEGVGCSNPSYIPKLSNLEITPVKGQRRFLLKWHDECSETAVSYDVLRCKDSGCTNFAIIVTINTNSFEDASGDLLFDTTYTYQVKARYNLQTATPTITKIATLGNIECFGQFLSNNFCIHESYYYQYQNYLLTNFPDEFSKNFADGIKNKFGSKFNKAFSCDPSNRLIPEGTSCSSTQVCVVDNNKPSCLSKINCNYNLANPFGLFYTLDDCETSKYCFYDRSHSTVNSCFSCNPSMACYDYKTEDGCGRDNCKVGNCKWKNLANQIGIGVCVSTNEYNCQWCDKKGTSTLENSRAFNEVFDFCTKEKSDVLSEVAFRCYFRNSKSKNCNNAVCTDYSAEQCSNTQINHDENNKLINPSADECGIKVCQNINNLCVKNADGDDKADCTNSACEKDYFVPNTTLLQVIRKGVVDSLLMQIYDRTSVNSSVILKTSLDYTTFLCVEPCNPQGHPYNASTTSKAIILSNLNAFDGNNGNKLLTLNEGANTLRYYSQDPAKNVEEIKKIIIEVHSNTAGPKIFTINITNSSKVLDKLYTNNQKPTIYVQFFEPAIVTFARLVNKKTGQVVSSFPTPTQLSNKASFMVDDVLPNGEYTFELNAKSKDNIFMDQPLSQIIVIDSIKPNLITEPVDGAIINASIITMKLGFDKEVNIISIKLNSDEIKNKFATKDNKIFTATINISDGNKKLEVEAADFAKNSVKNAIEFIVDANPLVITLINPKFGTASKPIFDIVIETDNNADCRYSLDNNFEFEFMDRFTTTGSTQHIISNFNKIASGDIGTHKLNIRCKDQQGTTLKSFDINVDTTQPQLKSSFAFPNPIIEKPSVTTLTVESNEPVICKFSNISKEFDKMEGKFEGFDNYIFKIINKQSITLENEGSYLYFVACKNKAELSSEVKEISFKVDLTISISITSHTPEFFNSTNVILAIETNKKSQCQFSETDKTAKSGEIFGAPGYSHTRQLISTLGKHTFYVICKDQFLEKFSDVATVIFTIDTTPPIILFVNDDSTLEDNPEFTYSKDSLRVKWNSIENESGISSHLYSVVDASTSNMILNWTPSNTNNQWVLVTRDGESLGLTNRSKYFFRVRAKNVVGLFSDAKESDGITVDTSLKPSTCSNKIKDSNETDVDCGGFCEQCEVAQKCLTNIDCKSSFCNNGVCAAPKCDDNIKNQQETDVDCGGSCKKCQNSKVCSSNNDCQSGFCSFGVCKPQESCSDGKLSPSESDIDCGGPCPTKCSEGKYCNADEDCSEKLECVSSICKKSITSEIEQPGILDSDGDGLPDEWEIQHGLNPNDPDDANIDSDNDGLTNLEEFDVQKIHGKSTDPNQADTDVDGFSDKEEIDKGTNPVDPEDFLKSNLTKVILFVLGITALLLGFGYLAYKVTQKKKEEKFELPRQRETPRVVQQQARQIPLRQREQDIGVREALKRKEEQKDKERKKLLEAFGKEGEENSKEEAKPIEKPELKVIKKEKKAKVETRPKKKSLQKEKKIQTKKPKEDVFIKLGEIAKEGKKRKQSKHKNAAK